MRRSSTSQILNIKFIGAVFLYKRAILSFGGNSTAFGTSFCSLVPILLTSTKFELFHERKRGRVEVYAPSMVVLV